MLNGNYVVTTIMAFLFLIITGRGSEMYPPTVSLISKFNYNFLSIHPSSTLSSLSQIHAWYTLYI